MNEPNEPQNDRYPDIEIYIQRVELSELINWLQTRLEVTDIQEQGKSTVLSLGSSVGNDTAMTNSSKTNSSMTCTIVPDAVKGKFTSVWIKPNNTSWLTDRDFALEALDHFQLETRCSTGSWDGNDEQGWLRLTPDSESIVNWLAD